MLHNKLNKFQDDEVCPVPPRQYRRAALPSLRRRTQLQPRIQKISRDKADQLHANPELPPQDPGGRIRVELQQLVPKAPRGLRGEAEARGHRVDGLGRQPGRPPDGRDEGRHRRQAQERHVRVPQVQRDGHDQVPALPARASRRRGGMRNVLRPGARVPPDRDGGGAAGEQVQQLRDLCRVADRGGDQRKRAADAP